MNLPALPTVRFTRGTLRIIDQTALPGRYAVVSLRNLDEVCDAISRLRVRGAPAIGIAGAYGLLIAIEEAWGGRSHVFDSGIGEDGGARESSVRALDGVPAGDVRARLETAAARIVSTRPTAVNLSWAVARMRRAWQEEDNTRSLCDRLLAAADAILREDLDMGRAMTAHGAALLPDGAAVLTHCNTGGLATGGIGTALGVVFAASAAGRRLRVFADETRPLLQGARLTAWECRERGVPVTVLVDGAAASLLSSGEVTCVMVGADRIARNGDTANKVGTLGLAIAAHRFGVPFYVVAPTSSIDASMPDGGAIPVEHRAAEEVTRIAGLALAPSTVSAYNPAFDVTPAGLITAIVTERGVQRPPFDFGGPA